MGIASGWLPHSGCRSHPGIDGTLRIDAVARVIDVLWLVFQHRPLALPWEPGVSAVLAVPWSARRVDRSRDRFRRDQYGGPRTASTASCNVRSGFSSQGGSHSVRSMRYALPVSPDAVTKTMSIV